MNFTELLSNPSMIHAAAVHMPIAAAVFGLMLIALSAIFHKNNTVRLITVLMFAIMAGSAWVGIETGEDARDLVPPTVSAAVANQITEHADSAERVMYAAIAVLVCLLISLIKVEFLRIGGLILAAVCALVANVFVAQTGHLGGALVYNHGVGTPMMKEVVAVEVPVPAEPAMVENTEVPAAEPPMEAAAPAPEPTPEPTPAPAPDESADWVPIREIDMEEAKKVSYIRDIWPVLDDQCVVCHESPDADGDYEVTSVEKMLLAGKKGGLGVVPGKPDESSIIKYIRGILNPRMPEDEDPLSEETVHLLRMWIAAGAIDDSDAPAPEATPAPAPEEAMTEEAPAADPAPEATPEPAPVPEEAMTDEAPAADPAPEATPEPAPAPEEAMTDEAPAAEPAPEATPEPAPAPEEAMTDEAPAADPAPEATPEPAPAPEEAMTDEAPAADPAPEATPAPVETPAEVVEEVKEAVTPEAAPEAPEAPETPAAPDVPEVAPANAA